MLEFVGACEIWHLLFQVSCEVDNYNIHQRINQPWRCTCFTVWVGGASYHKTSTRLVVPFEEDYEVPSVLQQFLFKVAAFVDKIIVIQLAKTHLYISSRVAFSMVECCSHHQPFSKEYQVHSMLLCSPDSLWWGLKMFPMAVRPFYHRQLIIYWMHCMPFSYSSYKTSSIQWQISFNVTLLQEAL